MRKSMDNIEEMEQIYSAAKDVFDGKYPTEYAAHSLQKKVSATKSSIKMYFNIFSCMINGKCYKMGTSETFTSFLLKKIYEDYGPEVFLSALSAAKGNYDYRVSVNNGQPGILRACKAVIQELSFPVNFEDIPSSFAPDSEGNDADSNGDNSTKLDYIESPSNLEAKKQITDDSDEIELNIQPAASIINVFSRLSYKPWYAIAEFVDNSTQSYISHEAELHSEKSFDKLVVDVRYDAQSNTLRITDNAFGMELDRFRDAILLDSRNETQSGRNEFGMGLKTAASWFGNIWSVTSTQLGSSHRYSATVDIPALKKYGMNSIKIHRDLVDSSTHGTEIFIRDVTKKITASRTIGKIRELLSSMYRRDINSRSIEIWFNGEPIVFEEYPILTNFRGKTWKKELDFDVVFAEKTYNVTGFVAIMNPGSFPKAGFALFRQDRVVVGGTDSNYKPAQIFGQAQSQRSLKLFGELNMNAFPVNQAKDGFIWDDGLEDAFIDALKENIQEYIDIAELSIKERAQETQYSDEASKKIEEEINDKINSAFEDTSFESSAEDNTGSENADDTTSPADESTSGTDSSDVQEYIETILNAPSEETLVGTIREYSVPINSVTKVKFNVQWAIGSKSYWIEYSESSPDVIDVIINIDHPFFMPFSKDEGFKRVLEKFALSFILSECQAKLTSDRKGYIMANVIKNYMNKYLEKLAEE
jgi:hypothetical protein